MLHIYLKYASYWLHIWSKCGYEGDLTTLLYVLILKFSTCIGFQCLALYIFVLQYLWKRTNVLFSNKGICLLYILFYSSVQIKGSKEFNFACFGKYHKLLVSFLSQSDVNVENNTILDTEGPWGINTMILQHCSNILFQQRWRKNKNMPQSILINKMQHIKNPST